MKIICKKINKIVDYITMGILARMMVCAGLLVILLFGASPTPPPTNLSHNQQPALHISASTADPHTITRVNDDPDEEVDEEEAMGNRQHGYIYILDMASGQWFRRRLDILITEVENPPDFGSDLARILVVYIFPFLLVGGIFWGIWIGVQFGTAKDETTRMAAKQRLIKAVATIFIIVAIHGTLIAINFNITGPARPPAATIVEPTRPREARSLLRRGGPFTELEQAMILQYAQQLANNFQGMGYSQEIRWSLGDHPRRPLGGMSLRPYEYAFINHPAPWTDPRFTGADCSLFTAWYWHNVMERPLSQLGPYMATSGMRNAVGGSGHVSTDSPQKGDLVHMRATHGAAAGHVGIYMGRDSQGQVIILDMAHQIIGNPVPAGVNLRSIPYRPNSGHGGEWWDVTFSTPRR
ncbi:MAG: C40 family peptidase [Firmicutes bacterium]|nr:C40 family peptidase [Bacillota bacterium]